MNVKGDSEEMSRATPGFPTRVTGINGSAV